MTKMFSTVAKREHALRCLLTLSKELDVGVHVRDDPELREIGVMLEKGDYFVAVTLSGTSRVPHPLAHWNVKHSSTKTFPPDFPARVNEYHRRKATGSHATLDDLLRGIREGFQKLKETD